MLAGGAVAWAVSNNDPDANPTGQGTDQPTAGPTGGPTQEPTGPAVPADELCTDEIMSNERWVCLTSATMDGGQLVIDYQAEWAGGVPDISTSYHLHIYGGDGTAPPDHVMGSHAGDNRGAWVIKDDLPAVPDADDIATAVGDAPKVCARIADTNHALVPAADGSFTTGNCVPIER